VHHEYDGEASDNRSWNSRVDDNGLWFMSTRDELSYSQQNVGANGGGQGVLGCKTLSCWV